MKNNKEKRDLRRVALLSIVWIIFFAVTTFIDDKILWICFGYSNAMMIMHIYYDNKIEKEHDRNRKLSRLFNLQTARYIDTLREKND